MDWTPNTTDVGQRRYAFGQQPQIAHWNLMMLARALLPLVSNREELERGLETYRSTLTATHQQMMLKKLGLTPLAGTDDSSLLEELHQSLIEAAVDITLFYRKLSNYVTEFISDHSSRERSFGQLIEEISYVPSDGAAHENLRYWLAKYVQRLRQEEHEELAVKRPEWAREKPGSASLSCSS